MGKKARGKDSAAKLEKALDQARAAVRKRQDQLAEAKRVLADLETRAKPSPAAPAKPATAKPAATRSATRKPASTKPAAPRKRQSTSTP